MVLISLMTFAFLAVGCGGGDEATDVARGFWDALEAGDIETARTFATAASASSLKMTENMEGKDVAATLGEVTEEAGEMFVETTVKTQADDTEMQIPMKTVLVQEDGAWKVDVEQTMMSLFGGAMTEMMKGMGKAMGEAMQGMGEEMGKAMQEGLEEVGDAVSEQAEDSASDEGSE
jgi:hypothetical protein